MWKLFLLIFHLLPFRLESENVDGFANDWQRRLLPKNYSKAFSSSVWDYVTVGKLNPTLVMIYVQPRAILKLSLKNLEFKIDLNLDFKWSDSRLSSQPSPLQHMNYDLYQLPREVNIQMWHPEVVFINCKECPEELIDPVKHDFNLQIQRISVHYRSTFSFNCMFDLSRYPFDSHFCKVELELTELKKHVIFKYNVLNNDFPKDQLQVPPEYKLKSIHTAPECTSQTPWDSDKFNCITYIFELCRDRSHHILTLFLPSILIVIISWLSFWMDLELMATPRLVLCLTCLVILMMQFNFAQLNLPPNSVVKASDVWMFICVFFVVATILEWALARYVSKKTLPSQQSPEKFIVRRPHKMSQMYKPEPKEDNFLYQKLSSLKRLKRKFKLSYIASRMQSTDQISKLAFPVFFLLFNLIYWSTYLTH